MRTKTAIVRDIRTHWAEIAERAETRDGGGVLPRTVSLLGSGTKTDKGEARGYLTAVVYMAPASSAFAVGSRRTLCPWATAECKAVCLGEHSGRLAMESGGKARLWKTTLYLGARSLWNELIDVEVVALAKRAAREGYKPAVRIDGATDTGEGARVARRHPSIQFYDYTKSARRARECAEGKLAPNYHVTFSYSGNNFAESLEILRAGGGVAVVFDTTDGKPLPLTWEGFPAINAEKDDARFTDPRGHVAALPFKAAADKAGQRIKAGGFVI